MGKIAIYQTSEGELVLKSDQENQTIWANQNEIAQLFNIDQSVISRHITNIFKSGEIDKQANMQKMHITGNDKPTIFYSMYLATKQSIIYFALPLIDFEN